MAPHQPGWLASCNTVLKVLSAHPSSPAHVISISYSPSTYYRTEHLATGEMSGKNPRTIIQYICKGKYRASSSSLKRNAFYVCACSTVYICVGYFLLLETVPHDRKVKPMKIFSSGKAPMPLEIWRRFQDFRHDWYRQRRARFDWQTMIKPCSDNMAWGLVKNHWGKQNRTSARKSEIVHQDIRPAGEFSKIFIQSKTADNQTKRIGGDSWRVNVAGPSAVSATVFDHLNGTYEALFLLTEPGVYEVRIVLDYSLCDGFKDPPRDWFIKGNAQGKFQKEGLLGALDHYMREPFDNGNPLIICVPEAQINTSFVELLPVSGFCSTTCNYLWDGFGRWINNEWKPYLEESYNVSLPFGYHLNSTLWIFGDSLGRYLTNSMRSRLLCQRLYTQCLNSYNWIYPVTDVNKGIQEDDDLDFRPERVIGEIVAALQNPLMQGEENVLLLNHGLHFSMTINFTTYQRLIEDLILNLTQKEVDSQGKRGPKYKAKIIWKTSTFIHKENVPTKNTTGHRFFTPQVYVSKD